PGLRREHGRRDPGAPEASHDVVRAWSFTTEHRRRRHPALAPHRIHADIALSAAWVSRWRRRAASSRNFVHSITGAHGPFPKTNSHAGGRAWVVQSACQLASAPRKSNSVTPSWLA